MVVACTKLATCFSTQMEQVIAAGDCFLQFHMASGGAKKENDCNQKETTSFDAGFQLVETEISTLDPAVLEFSLLRGAIILFVWSFGVSARNILL